MSNNLTNRLFSHHEFREEIKTQISPLSKEQGISFARRCAIRALPFMGGDGDFNFLNNKDRQRHLMSVFWAIDVAVNDDYYVDYVAAANAANAADAADDAYAADAYAAAVDAAAAYAYAAAVDPAAYAAAYAAADDADFKINFQKSILEDLQGIKDGKKPKSVSLEEYGEVWSLFLSALEKEGCTYWGKLVQQWLESGFEEDEQALERRLNVPKEIRKQGAAAVARHLEGLKKGARRLNESRIIILGDKGAGKTSLARKLIDPNCDLPSLGESTLGVDTTLWEMEEEDFNVRIWDFAGHIVTHAVHQFFLSEKCLYILVCNGRQEEYNRLEYWLSQMQIYGGASEVMILVNKTDKHDHSIPINKLRGKYSIVNFADFSLAEDLEGIERFRVKVKNYVLNHPS